MSGFFDNWYYFGRIGVYTFKSEAESTLISRCGTVPTILIYTMELCKEYSVANKEAAGDRDKFLKTLFERRFFILQKLLEYPVRFLSCPYAICLDIDLLFGHRGMAYNSKICSFGKC